MPSARDLISSAAAALKERADEVNRLNVFPVPDGDTGTNMSLTMDAVVAAMARLDADATMDQVRHAVTHGSLMGARGNSGVILSQILRGLCEGIDGATSLGTPELARALEQAATVAYQAVRKPVEGTMLTVIRESAEAARTVADRGLDTPAALEAVAAAAFASVKRTPELLPVLRENGVVDAGGFGLAILFEGFVAAALGHRVVVADVSSAAAPLDHVVPVDDWDDDEYLYCTEFLLFGDDIDKDAVHAQVSKAGGSELVVGDDGSFKVHVHTNDPGSVLSYVTGLGEVAEVHINNMRRQTVARDAKMRAEEPAGAPRKALGFVAVAAGDGLAQILHSLGVDEIVSGGQTMNPSTQDLLEAVARVDAEAVVILPNNKNIQMAAASAASVADRPVSVVPTRSVPQAFAALLAYDGSADLDGVVASMTEAAEGVRTGEVTTAVKDAKGKVGAIKSGQFIGIVDDSEIEAAGADVSSVAFDLADLLLSDGAETLTLLVGADLDDQAADTIATEIGKRHSNVGVEVHRGDQPLYPLIIAAE